MKKVIVSIFAIVFLFEGVAHANFINVLSQNYDIYVFSTTYDSNVSVDEEWFNQTSTTTPLSVSYSGYKGYGYASVVGGVSSKDAFVYTFVEAFAASDCIVSSEAAARMLFSPLVSRILVSFYSQGLYTGLSLRDDTTGEILLFLGVSDPDISAIISFDLSHIYSLTVGSSASFNEVAGAGLRLQPVPEPATMLLLGLGLVGLVGIRRKL